MRLQVRDLTRRFPTIVIAVAAISAVFAVLLGDVGDRYVFTFAGTGEAGAGGDGGLATEAQFTFPTDPAVDGVGNVYVADSGNQRIRRIDTEGVITTIAGSGPVFSQGGYSGDGGASDGGAIRFTPWTGVGRVGQRLRGRLGQPANPGHQTAGRKESCHQ